MTQGWPIPTTAQEYLRQLDRRLKIQERRAAAQSAADLVGPGIAARAIQVYDWNDETTTFNGFFYSTPGARNAPEPGFEWNGSVTARADGSGTQQLVNPQGTATFLSYVRTFKQNPTDPSLIIWGPWKQFATHTGKIDTPQLSDPVVTDIQTALDEAAEAIEFTQTAIWVFRQNTEPVPGVNGAPATFKEGYVWYNTTTEPPVMKIWSEDQNDWVDPDYGMTPDQEAALAQAQADATQALELAEDALNYAASANTTWYQSDAPANNLSRVGDTWYEIDASNRMRIFNGAGWVDPEMTLVGPKFRWPENAGTGTSPNVVPGVVITSNGLTLSANTGTTVFLNGSTGAASFTGSVTSGGTVTGAIITGGTIQTETTASRGIKMTSAGLIGYDALGVAKFSLTTVGGLALMGEIQSGSTISGARLTGILETSATANVGVKMSNSGIFVYNSSNALTWSVTASTGQMQAVGGVITFGNIASTLITGGTIQTDLDATTGIKLTTTGLVAYGGGVSKFVLSATTGDVTLAGSVIAGGSILGTTFNTRGSGARVHISDEGGTSAYVRLPYGLGESLSQAGGIGSIQSTGAIQVASGVYPGASSGSAIVLQADNSLGLITMNGTIRLNFGLIVSNMTYMPNAGDANPFRRMLIHETQGYARLSSTYSSRRWKRDIRSLDSVGEAVLGIKPVLFKYKKNAPGEHEDFDRVHKGLIAETLHEAGLTNWIYYKDGKPSEIDYDMWSIAVHAAVRCVDKKVEELKREKLEAFGRIEALEARLAAAGI